MPGPLGLPAAPSEAEFLEGVPSLLCWDTGSATVSHSWACGDSTLLVRRLWLLKASGPGVCAGAGLSHPQTLKPCPGITVYRVRPWRGSRAVWSGSGAQHSGLMPPAQCTVPSALALGLCSLLGAPGPGGREGGWPLWGREMDRPWQVSSLVEKQRCTEGRKIIDFLIQEKGGTRACSSPKVRCRLSSRQWGGGVIGKQVG